MSPRRGAAVWLAALALVAIGAIWAIPNLAGSAFVGVELVGTPVAGEAGTGQRHVVLGGGPSTLAGALKLAIRIEGRYPLPVVVRASNPPLRVELRAEPQAGPSSTVWSITGSAAELEGGGDSPDGPATAGAVLVRPGQLEVTIGPTSGIRLEDGAGAKLAAGRYVLQAWALGIASDPLGLIVSD